MMFIVLNSMLNQKNQPRIYGEAVIAEVIK